MVVTLSPKQVRALAMAPPNAKSGMRATFNSQNSLPKSTQRARQRQRGSPTAMMNMPRGAATGRSIMPDAGKYHWDQTPASSNIIAPRGFGYYDAFTHSPGDAVTAFSVGPATPIQANTRAGLTTIKPDGVGESDLGVSMIIVYPAASDVQAALFTCGATVSDPVIETPFRSPQLNPSGGPESVMATRCSLQVRNITQVLNQGGVVRSLRITTGIIGPQILNVGTSQDLLDLAENVRNHARTRSYSGADLVENKQINCTVVDQTRATTFLDFAVNVPIADLPWYPEPPTPLGGAVGPFQQGLHNPTFTPIILLFESFPTKNTYEVSIRTQFLAHYVQGSMLANLAMTPPSVGEKLNAHRDNEERKGSILHDVGRVLENVGNWGVKHRGEIMGGIGAMKWAIPKLAPMIMG
jgi:hypothetical protein